jgi:DNA-binding MarR family transcriptional regulator
VKTVVTRAGVSEEAFHAVFDSPEECLLAAFDDGRRGSADGVGRTPGEAGRPGDRPGQAEGAYRAPGAAEGAGVAPGEADGPGGMRSQADGAGTAPGQADRADSARSHADRARRARELPIRATYRTTRVLDAIASAPESSNREIADLAGLSDEGQASKLLARLVRRELIENVGRGHAWGESNAWVLTPYGRRVVELLEDGRVGVAA